MALASCKLGNGEVGGNGSWGDVSDDSRVVDKVTSATYRGVAFMHTSHMSTSISPHLSSALTSDPRSSHSLPG